MNWTQIQHAYAFFASTVAPFLLATLIPSIVVALTNYPKASKFLKVLSGIAQFLSVLTHRDQAGTMKMPFAMSFTAKAPDAKAGPAVALAFLTLFSGGCAWLQKHPTASAELSCAEDAIVKGLPAVIADVAAALSGQSPDWAALGKLELQNGPSLIICAAMKLTGQPAAQSPQFIKNAKEYLRTRGR